MYDTLLLFLLLLHIIFLSEGEKMLLYEVLGQPSPCHTSPRGALGLLDWEAWTNWRYSLSQKGAALAPKAVRRWSRLVHFATFPDSTFLVGSSKRSVLSRDFLPPRATAPADSAPV